MKRLSGLALLAKPAGITSFQALGPIKARLGSGKVGHAGTLDRFATGLLVVLAGAYSRLAPYFTALDKHYAARVRFGAETATLDPEGEVIAEAPPPSRAALEAVLPLFRGSILQAPPAYSAIHLDGKRAYERVRSGERLDMPKRPVSIYALELVSYDGQDAELLVHCSSGTYIRSLARDLAVAAGSRASLVALERRAIGPLELSAASAPMSFEAERDLRCLDPRLACALGFRPRMLAERYRRGFCNGLRLETRVLGDLPDMQAYQAPISELSAVFDTSGDFLGLVAECGPFFEYRLVIGEA